MIGNYHDTLKRVRFLAFVPHNIGVTKRPRLKIGKHEQTPAEKLGWKSTQQIRNLIEKLYK
jgi:hypothetical protein